MKKSAVFVIAIMALMVSTVALMPASDADVIQDDVLYCYGDHPTLLPFFNDSDTQWSAEDQDGNTVSVAVDSETGVASIDLTGHDEVIVTQVVGDQTARARLIAVHMSLDDSDGDGEHNVSFYDMGSIIHTHTIDGSTVVALGEPHVEFPEEPSKEGYTFGGWYTDPSFTDGSEFDGLDVVRGDIDVYAKWVPTSNSGSGGSITIGTHLVTFECSSGLTYSIVERGSNFVSFTVSVIDGFDVDESTIEVEANGTTLQPVDGIYTISGINSDVHVTINGTIVGTEDPSDGIPFWVWIVLIIVIVLAVAVVYWMYIRNQRQ